MKDNKRSARARLGRCRVVSAEIECESLAVARYRGVPACLGCYKSALVHELHEEPPRRVGEELDLGLPEREDVLDTYGIPLNAWEALKTARTPRAARATMRKFVQAEVKALAEAQRALAQRRRRLAP